MRLHYRIPVHVRLGGYVWACPACHVWGAGRDRDAERAIAEATGHANTCTRLADLNSIPYCPNCDGAGYMFGAECIACRGTGRTT